MYNRIVLVVFILFFYNNGIAQTMVFDTLRVYSPDHRQLVKFYQKEDYAKKRMMYYQVFHNNKPVILESCLDIQLDNNLSEKAMALKVDKHVRWCENLVVDKVSSLTKDTVWVPVNGEQAKNRDHYNESDIELVKDDNAIYVMQVQIRAYNEGIAIRYFFPENVKGTYYSVTAENTTFHLPTGAEAWFANWAQGPYYKLPISNWPGESERPLTVELADSLYICLTEARMVDYARTKFKLDTGSPNTIITAMYDRADLISPVGTPWRVIMIADKPGDLIEHDYLIQNLNDVSKITDTGWIKPGKIMRVMTQTTAAAKANIDFAAKQNLQYILFDWKWYGPAFDFASDATKVAIPDFDLPEIIRYGKERNIGVWLYVNQQAALAQSDSLFAVYHKWGIKGVKIGFVQVGSHRWTTWQEKVIQQAADNHIMLNIHDEWRPTGEQRTWPNLLTAEGVRGNEEMPDATHNTILPFTRFIAGAADYTICYFDKRIKTTHAHQLALAAIYYSPLQTLFWYDKPSDYHNEPELEFWNKIPTTWDETKVIQGEPGKFITTARRKGQDWFVGTITNNDARTLIFTLNFLDKGKQYVAKIFDDDTSAAGTAQVKIESKTVTENSLIKVNLKPSGGQAIYITPKD
ncbi:alpha-glucosidase [Mucilaginibacter mallensis]|uniref:Alpha-glucosidase n=1 Tax=Mucilaginibacter mallensis TaxID=652787 RepID=A0A1H1ZTK1_MUCMA|nr:glycoside hydrolase family 97 protein [Mucilaginibacter mallensis]SDT36606.1 alpha-glucosidase [Mucilaginibacter mallensis]